ncbi:uncharacterized protein LOC119384104 [Rhipicephalus sanguineus]|uniref:uncharacterized protein LOC119384104 n=1 Tax=Rhipicephalus sanguineus TaxID=34632 RepID=UPI0020C40FDA|nr:uncharacterized protein LOC119384104 [Rhipicephalus sanguineus]
MFFEPTDVRKAVKPFLSDAWRHLSIISPNLAELRAMHAALASALGTRETIDGPAASTVATDPVEEGALLGSRLARHIPVVLVTLGVHGALLVERLPSETTKEGQEPVKVLHYPTSKLESVQSVSGAGDCLAGGFLCGLLQQLPWDRCMGIGMAAARRSLMSSDTVPDTVGADCLDAVSTSRTVDLQRTSTAK